MSITDTEVCKNCRREWRVTTTAREYVLCTDCSGTPTLPEGQVRRDSDGTLVVCLGGNGGGLRWKVIGEDPHGSVRYGWRYDRDVRDWPVLGNVHDFEHASVAA